MSRQSEKERIKKCISLIDHAKLKCTDDEIRKNPYNCAWAAWSTIQYECNKLNK